MFSTPNYDFSRARRIPPQRLTFFLFPPIPGDFLLATEFVSPPFTLQIFSFFSPPLKLQHGICQFTQLRYLWCLLPFEHPL